MFKIKQKSWIQFLKYVHFGYKYSLKKKTLNYSSFYLLQEYHPESIFDYNFISIDTSLEILNKLE